MRIQQAATLFEDMRYPVTTEELITATGSQQIALANGMETIGEVLDRVEPESFTSPDDIRLAFYSGLSDEAIGRKGYSDRDPPTMNEVQPLSF